MPASETAIEAPLRHVHKALQHDSGVKHVQGSAEYIDDMLEPGGTLHIALGGSPVAVVALFLSLSVMVSCYQLEVRALQIAIAAIGVLVAQFVWLKPARLRAS